MDGATDNSNAAAVERRLAVPVLVAALVSVPAVCLTLWGEGPVARIGNAAHWLSAIVLWAESLVLFLLSEDRIAWVREHKWSLAAAVAAIPAVVLVIGPAQVLRLVQTVGALRVLRVSRVLDAGTIIRRRLGLTGPWSVAVVTTASTIAAALTAAVLADPTSTSRRVVESALQRFGVWPTVAAGLVLGISTVLVLAYRSSRPDRAGEDGSG